MISLQKNVGRCHVNTGWASRMQSDRFLNANTMVCPPATQVDDMGRHATPDSLVTKTAGCNSAADRVVVEDGQRPSTFSAVGLSNYGMEGGICNTPNWQHMIPAGSPVTRIVPPVDDAAYNSLLLRSQQWVATGAETQYYKRLSGCL